MNTGRILIIDDNKSVLSALEILLQDDFEIVNSISNPNQIPSMLGELDYDLVLLDMNFSAGINTGNEGIYWLTRIKELKPEIEVVLITAYGDVELAVKALHQGGADFVLKPWDNDKLLSTLKNVYQLQQSRREVKAFKRREHALKGEINRFRGEIIAQSPQMQHLMNLVRKVADSDANVLITGDNGTGKELIARELHLLSNRSDEIIVSVDLGAITETLFDSELFGHSKGSFTGAQSDRMGRIESANRGTLFLDEIGNLPLHLQPKLLAALQNREVTPVGSNKPVPTDVRLICATNQDLDKLVIDGVFREDLLYRVNTIHIEIPPLHERKLDILALADHFLLLYNAKYRKQCHSISASARLKLTNYHWPGNVRELQHAVERAVILSERRTLAADDFVFKLPASDAGNVLSGTIEEMERKMICHAVQHSRTNLTITAQQLGITRQTLFNKMKKYGI